MATLTRQPQSAVLSPTQTSYDMNKAQLSPTSSPTSASQSQQSDKSFLQSSFIREDWIEKELAKRVVEFTEAKPFTCHIGSWNVNAKRPNEDLSDWLLSAAQKADTSLAFDLTNIETECDSHLDPDMYVIGFQEIVDLNAGNLVLEHSATRPWEDKIERTLKQRYVQIAAKSLVGLALLVYIKRKWQPYVSSVEVEKIGVGVLGVGGNKGAVAIRFQLFDSSICFVNSHLAAHQHNTPGRNADYASIMQKLRFNDRERLTTYDILQHDYVFWLGDLNYRINVPDLNLLHTRIEEKDWAYLLANDQLLQEKASGNCFHHFHEAPIAFAPTYKYTPGSHKYERREDKKKRLPAWCDRIQWRCKDEAQAKNVHCSIYDRAELCTSDHKPVYGVYQFDAKILVAEKREAVRHSLVAALDAQENSLMPKVSLSSTVISFGVVPFDRAITQTIRIENVGQTVAAWACKPKADNANIHESWLSVEPLYGLLPIGGHQDVVLTCHVTSRESSSLLLGTMLLEDILILGLDHGRDFFVTLSADYRKSAFGATIEYLVNTPGPVRFAPNPSDPSSTPNTVLSLPKELWRMCDYIFTNGMDEPGLFLTSGVQAEVESIIDSLDCATPFNPNISIHSMAEALMYFLNHLAEPLFPLSLVEQYDGTNLTTFCRQTALSQLTPCHYNVFIYLIAFLRELLTHRAKNGMNPVKIVIIFASALCHFTIDENDPVYGLQPGKQKPKAWIILRHFLVSAEFP